MLILDSTAGSTTFTMPYHEVRDLIIVYAFRSGSTTPPTMPAGYTLINNETGANSCSALLCYKFAASSSETSGTFTNATTTTAITIRGCHPASPIGRHATAGGTGTTMTYPALERISGGSIFLGFGGHRSTNVSIETSPAGMDDYMSYKVGSSVGIHSTPPWIPAQSNWPSTSVSVGGTSSGYRTAVLEIAGYYGGPQLVGINSAGATSVTIPAHTAGDMLVLFAYRDGSNTAPTQPAGWTSITTGGANTNSFRLCYRIASGSGTSSGTWTNATQTVAAVFRDVGSTPVGGSTYATGTGNIPYGTVTLTDTYGSILVAFAGHRSVNTALEIPPMGMSNMHNRVNGSVDETAVHMSPGNVIASELSTVTLGGTSSGRVSAVVEIRGSRVSGDIDPSNYDMETVFLGRDFFATMIRM